jgi:transposase-like protein
MPYSKAFKNRMIQRMTGPNAMSATALSKESGVSQSTLSNWLREAGSVAVIKRDKSTEGERQAGARRPRDRSVEEKMRVLKQAASITPEMLGELLRREGLHEADLLRWEQEIRDSLAEARSQRATLKEKDKKIKALERELRRKEKALAEAAALLVLKKKVQEIWGDEDDGTDPRSGR